MYPQGVCRIRKPAYAGNGCAIFLVFQTEEVGQKDGCGSQTQLRGVALSKPIRKPKIRSTQTDAPDSFFAALFGGNLLNLSRTNLLPPLGVVRRAANRDSNDCQWQSYLCFVPRSGKGGVVGDFELLPINGAHPLCDSLRAA